MLYAYVTTSCGDFDNDKISQLSIYIQIKVRSQHHVQVGLVAGLKIIHIFFFFLFILDITPWYGPIRDSIIHFFPFIRTRSPKGANIIRVRNSIIIFTKKRLYIEILFIIY